MASRRLFDGAAQEIGSLPIVASVVGSKLWIKVSGSWKQATTWLKVSGTWKQTTVFFKNTGTWK